MWTVLRDQTIFASNSSKAPPNPGGGSLMTEHTDPCKTCYYP